MKLEVALDYANVIENVTLQYDIKSRRWFARVVDNIGPSVRGGVILANGNGVTIEAALDHLAKCWKLEYERKKL